MKYNQLGKTDLKLSQISLGGAVFSNIYEQTEKGSEDLIRECFKRGINYLETGPWYGQGSSERIISKALLGVPRSAFFIGSKVGRYDLEIDKMFDFSAERSEVAVDTTLQRLQLDYVDIIQIHDPTFAADKSVILKETLPALERAVRDGKARYIGLCDYDVELMQEIVEESDVKISSILSYAKSTLIDNRLQNHIKFFKSKRVGVINAAATSMGLLTNRGPQPWHPANDHIKILCKQASEYCSAQNVELGRLATWYSINQPDIDTNVLGFSNTQQLLDTLDVLDNGLTKKEKMVLDHIQTRFFNNTPLQWDQQERSAYLAKLNEILKK